MDAASTLGAPPQAARFRLRVTPLRLVASLLFLALALRSISIASRPLWLDEAFSAWFADRSFDYLWHVLPTYEAHPPLYYSILKSWRLVFGGTPLALRSLSVLFGVLAVPVVIAAAREQERLSPTGRPLLHFGLAGFLAASSPVLVFVGQEARPYPLLVLAYSVAILGLLQLMQQFRQGSAGKWPAWILFGAGSELTLWAHSLGLLYASCLALALAPHLLNGQASRARIVRGAITAIIVALTYAPCLLLVMNRVHDWEANWLHWEPSMLFQLMRLYMVPVETLTLASAITALAMLLLIKRALVSTYLSRGWNSDRALLLLWLGPPMLAALVSALFVPVFLARTLSGTFVPLYLIVGGALARSREPFERRIIAAMICITLLPSTIALAMRPPSERWDLVASYLSRNVGAKDQVWLYPADSALPIDAIGAHVRGKLRPIPEPFPTTGFKGPIRAGWPGARTPRCSLCCSWSLRIIPGTRGQTITRLNAYMDTLGHRQQRPTGECM